ncbi:MAG: PQQ-binding-like beta-propeller repeat protein [Thermoplasmatota archaeon]
MPLNNKVKAIVLVSFLLINVSIAVLATAQSSSGFIEPDDKSISEMNDLEEEEENQWPSFGYDRRNTHQSPYNSSHVDGSLKWKLDVSSPIEYSSPSIDENGNIYIGTSRNILYSIDENGDKNWSFDAGGDVSDAIYSTPAIYNNHTFFGSRDGYLYSLDSNGSKNWGFRTKGALDSSPTISIDGSIIIGCGDHKLYSVGQDGTPNWVFSTDGWIESTPAVDGRGHIYVGSSDSNFYSIDQSGNEVWSYSSGDGIFSSPTISSDGKIYVGSWDGYFYSLNNNGSLEWKYEIGSKIFSSPAIGPNGNIYVGAQDGKLYSFNDNGTLRWSFETEGGIRSSPAVDSVGNLYFGSEDYNVYSLNSQGNLRWKYKTEYTITSSPSIGKDGTVYIASHDHKVYAFTGSPSEPQNVNAESHPERVKLTWEEPKENGGSEIEGYKIYRSQENDNFTFLTSVSSSSREFNDLNVTNGETYYYQISAVNKDVEGEKSDSVNATPHDTVPSPPSNLTVSESDLKINLNWSAPEYAGGSEITHYNVYRGTNSTNLNQIGNPNKTEYVDTNIEKGITYYYYVTAVNDVGESDTSNLESIKITTKPSQPRNLSAEEDDQNILLDWQSPLDDGGIEITYYNLYRGESSQNLSLYVNTTSTQYGDADVEAGKTYFYYVTAVNEINESEKSNTVNESTSTVPSSPTNLTASPYDENIEIDWGPPEEDGGCALEEYRIYRGTESDNITYYKNLSSDQTYFLDDLIDKGITYYYQVSAVNEIGESELSENVRAKVTTEPSSPFNLTAIGYEKNISISWEKPADDGGLQILKYNIYRGINPDNMSFYQDVNSTKYNDSDVDNETIYYYYVTAINDKGESNPTDVVNSSLVSTPSAPLNLEAEPGNSTVNLSWSPPPECGSEDIIEYRIYRGEKRNELEYLTSVNGNITNYTDDSVENENNYFYSVSAVNNAGEGPESDVVKARPSWRYAPGLEFIPLMIALIMVSIYVAIKKKKR